MWLNQLTVPRTPDRAGSPQSRSTEKSLQCCLQCWLGIERYAPGRLTARTWEYGPPGKGRSPSKPSFSGSMINLPGVYILYHNNCQLKVESYFCITWTAWPFVTTAFTLWGRRIWFVAHCCTISNAGWGFGLSKGRCCPQTGCVWAGVCGVASTAAWSLVLKKGWKLPTGTDVPTGCLIALHPKRTSCHSGRCILHTKNAVGEVGAKPFDEVPGACKFTLQDGYCSFTYLYPVNDHVSDLIWKCHFW